MSNSPLFTQVQATHLDRNNFDLSFKNLLTADFGKLIPVMCKPVIPGDSWNISQEVFARMSPMNAPILDKMNATIHTFFVPMRLIWDDFEKFITGGKDGTFDVPVPQFNLPASEINNKSVRYRNKFVPNGYEGGDTKRSLFKTGNLLDYLGAPVPKDNSANYGQGSNFIYSQLPIRAYNKIYNDYYVDQNVGTPAIEKKDSLDITSIDENIFQMSTIKYRSYRKDYFTSALPWTQRGPAVTIPFSSQGSVTIPGARVDHVSADGGIPDFEPIKTGAPDGSLANRDIRVIHPMSGESVVVSFTDSRGEQTYQVDMQNATSTINDLRTAYALQRWYERNARGGSRYIEQLLSHFGVVSSDARLQRSEYLGGMVTPIVVDSVTETTSAGVAPLGSQAGQGLLYSGSENSEHYFDEHGIVMSILSIMPDVSYMDQVPKEWLKTSRFEWFFPEFEHLGEQAIANKEIYDGYGSLTEAQKNATFGYTPRYAEYKFSPNEVHGNFKNNLSYWHLGRSFANLPTLNDDFLRAGGADNYKIFPVDSVGEDIDDHFYVQVENKLFVKRPMAFYADPI